MGNAFQQRRLRWNLAGDWEILFDPTDQMTITEFLARNNCSITAIPSVFNVSEQGQVISVLSGTVDRFQSFKPQDYLSFTLKDGTVKQSFSGMIPNSENAIMDGPPFQSTLGYPMHYPKKTG